jgi:hypothetical protein
MTHGRCWNQDLRWQGRPYSGSLQPVAKLPKHTIGLGVVGGGLNVRNVAEAAQSGKAGSAVCTLYAYTP